jgi:hypothetical protein
MGVALYRTQSEENCRLKTGKTGFYFEFNTLRLHKLPDK